MREDPTTLYAREAIAGSSEALDWLVRRFEGCLMAKAHEHLERACVHSMRPEDLVQETWATLWRKLGELGNMLEGRQRVTPRLMKYLATTLQRIHMNHRRREIRRRRKGDLGPLGSVDVSADPIAELPDETRGIITRIGHRELSDRVYNSIRALDEVDRRILILRGIDGTSLAAAGELLGMKPDAISKRYNRCLQKLKKQLPDSVLAEFDEDRAESA